MKWGETLRRSIVPRLALGLVGALAVAAGGLEQPAFGIACLVVAAVCRDSTERERERSALLSYGVTGWSIFGLLPLVTIGERLGGPYGGHPLFFVLQGAISLFNGWGLQRDFFRRPRS